MIMKTDNMLLLSSISKLILRGVVKQVILRQNEDDFETKSKHHSFNKFQFLLTHILSFQDVIILRNKFCYILFEVVS